MDAQCAVYCYALDWNPMYKLWDVNDREDRTDRALSVPWDNNVSYLPTCAYSLQPLLLVKWSNKFARHFSRKTETKRSNKMYPCLKKWIFKYYFSRIITCDRALSVSWDNNVSYLPTCAYSLQPLLLVKWSNKFARHFSRKTETKRSNKMYPCLKKWIFKYYFSRINSLN